ncbi:two-component system, response regulator YesN [Lachnospiraceae bacterium G41]|nr:two-component system, response regulator YesN [Lachnospiraceae bacterium G41]
MKVFLVDDEIVIREGIRESFPWEDTPYSLVGEAPDGEMALPIIRDTNPDIVITDIKMPFMDGLELCRELKSQMPWIGIIVLSGYDEFEYARQCIKLGVREYLLKPINSADLREALDKVSAQLKEERKTLEHAASLRARMEDGGKFLKEKLIGSLFSDETALEDAHNVLKQLRSMGCPVPAPFYVVIDAAFSPTGTGQEAAALLAESSGGIVNASASRTGTRLLVLGDTAEDAEERAYAVATSLSQELERSECKEIRVGIGEIVDNPEKIFQSFKTARHIRHLLAERKDERAVILGVREMGEVSDEKVPSVISEAKLYMSQNYSNANLMLQDVAKAVNMSKSRFSTVFSQTTGQSFTEYLIYLRLSKAKELLKTSNLKSSQIATEIGYNDSHYFSYIFKKNVGMTPSDYRSQYQNQPE